MKKLLSFVKPHKVVIGTIWGISTTCISLYLTIWPIEQNPKLTIYQKQKFDIFTYDKPLDGLEVLLNKSDIRKDSFNLKVYKLKIINEGKRDIRYVDYSAETPFEIEISGGKAVRANVEQPGQGRIDRALVAGLNPDSTAVEFKKVFIGKDEFEFIDVWVLHKNNMEPTLSVSGKIADTGIEYSQEDESKNIDWFLLLKGVLFFGGCILALLLLDFLVASMKNSLRKHNIKKLYGDHYYEGNKIHRVIVKIYCLTGRRRFKMILSILGNVEMANNAYQTELNNKRVVESYYNLSKSPNIDTENKIRNADYKSEILTIIGMLKNAGMLATEDSKVVEIKDDFLREIVVINNIVNQN